MTKAVGIVVERMTTVVVRAAVVSNNMTDKPLLASHVG